MFAGIIAGVTWAIETALLWGALSLSPLSDFAFLAPLVATFLHDLCSAIFATAYNGIRGNLKKVWNREIEGILLITKKFRTKA